MTHDYGEHAPGPPSAEAVAERDRLAEEMAAAASPRERVLAEEQLVLHMLTEGLPLEDFSTPDGRAFSVKVSVSKPKVKAGRERDARAWLKGRSARTLAHKLLARGQGLPPELFEPLHPRVHVAPADEVQAAPPQRRQTG